MKKLNKKQKLIILISIATIIVILGLIIGANVIRTNIANNSYESSNSGSSNGNLLPEYIKKGITLGGVTGTLESLDTSDATATAEDIAWGKTAYVKGEKITGTYLTLGMLEIGDYVAYTPDSAGPYTGLTQANTGSSTTTDDSFTQESLSWRVLSINDDRTVDLISSAPTSQNIYFFGYLGYNNGVYLLNDVAASLYSNSRLGATARSLTIEDVEAGMNEAGIEYVRSYSANGTTVGDTATFTSRYYPNLYAQENGSGIDLATTNDPNSAVKTDGIGQSDSYYSEPTTETYTQASSSLTATGTYYNRSMSSGYYKNSTFYSMVHSGSTYWLASRFVSTSSSTAGFGLRYVSRVKLLGYTLFTSNYGFANSIGYRLRPLVSLSSNIRLSSGDGSEGSPYQMAE